MVLNLWNTFDDKRFNDSNETRTTITYFVNEHSTI